MVASCVAKPDVAKTIDSVYPAVIHVRDLECLGDLTSPLGHTESANPTRHLLSDKPLTQVLCIPKTGRSQGIDYN